MRRTKWFPIWEGSSRESRTPPLIRRKLNEERDMMEVSSSNKMRISQVLVLYTGGTIGMKKMDSGKKIISTVCILKVDVLKIHRFIHFNLLALHSTLLPLLTSGLKRVITCLSLLTMFTTLLIGVILSRKYFGIQLFSRAQSKYLQIKTK